VGGKAMRLIDADKLLDLMSDPMFKEGFRETMKIIIKNTPTIDAVPVVRGRWRTWEEQFPDRTTKKKNNLGVFCSVCQLHADNMTSYCPNCGARMDGAE
jgi:uncharacterized paraquat-inducible protein A